MAEDTNTLILAGLMRLEAGLIRLETGLGEMRAELGSLRAEVGSLRAEVADLRSGQESLRAEVADLRSGQESLRADVETLRQELALLKRGQDTLSADYARLRDELLRVRVDLMERMDRLQNTLAAQQEADTVNYGAAERAERIAMSARDEGRLIGEQMNVLIRQVRRLQEQMRELRGEP